MAPTDTQPWYRSRSYLHFDRPISESNALKIVSNPIKVSQRSFLPFIELTLTSTKIKWDKEAKKLVKKEKLRHVAYASHIDSHIYSYYSTKISVAYERALRERDLEKNILAFRKLNLSNVDFARIAFDEIKRRGECCAIALDIEGFFDNLDHAILKKAWCTVLGVSRLPPDHFAVFQSITKYSKVDRDLVYGTFGISKHNTATHPKQICDPVSYRGKVRKLIQFNHKKFGIPQGSSISASLSNIYLIEFDDMMKKFVGTIDGEYFRYCDDILLIAPKHYRDAISNYAERIIQDYKLRIQTKKTEKREFLFAESQKRGRVLRADKPLQYLGFLFDGERTILRSASLARFSDRLRRGTKLALATMRKRNQQRLKLGLEDRPLYKKKLRERYTHFGRRNFLTYGYRAAEKMDSREIKQQLKPLLSRFKQRTEKNV